MKRCEAIIGAMTEEERSNPELITAMVCLYSCFKDDSKLFLGWKERSCDGSIQATGRPGEAMQHGYS